MEIDQAKALEYKQVAGLLCMDIDILVDIANSGAGLGDLLWQVRDLAHKKAKMISDKKERESRYSAAELVFGTAAMRTESSEGSNANCD